MSESDNILKSAGDDPGMLVATEKARETFRYFWKEVATDFNRIIPALEMACVKAIFTDDNKSLDIHTEHMWIDEIDFDGEIISGVLINTPNWVTSISEGDRVSIPAEKLSDWMLVIDGKVYGAYTVQTFRSRMSEQERIEHDKAWGYNFPEPNKVLMPEHSDVVEDNLASGLSDYLKENPDKMDQSDELGRTLLHLEVLYGRQKGVLVLLKSGANIRAKCNKDWTPLRYATAVGWDSITKLLKKNGAKE